MSTCFEAQDSFLTCQVMLCTDNVRVIHSRNLSEVVRFTSSIHKKISSSDIFGKIPSRHHLPNGSGRTGHEWIGEHKWWTVRPEPHILHSTAQGRDESYSIYCTVLHIMLVVNRWQRQVVDSLSVIQGPFDQIAVYMHSTSTCTFAPERSAARPEPDLRARRAGLASSAGQDGIQQAFRMTAKREKCCWSAAERGDKKTSCKKSKYL